MCFFSSPIHFLMSLFQVGRLIGHHAITCGCDCGWSWQPWGDILKLCLHSPPQDAGTGDLGFTIRHVGYMLAY